MKATRSKKMFPLPEKIEFVNEADIEAPNAPATGGGGARNKNTHTAFPPDLLPQLHFPCKVLLESRHIFPWQQMFFWGRQKGEWNGVRVWGVWGFKPSCKPCTEAIHPPAAPFVHISVTAERPRGQSLEFPQQPHPLSFRPHTQL